MIAHSGLNVSTQVFVRLTSYLKIIHPGGLATMQPCFLTDRCEIPYTWKILQQRTSFGSHPVSSSDTLRYWAIWELPAPVASKKPLLHHLHHQAHCTSPRAGVPCRWHRCGWRWRRHPAALAAFLPTSWSPTRVALTSPCRQMMFEYVHHEQYEKSHSKWKHELGYLSISGNQVFVLTNQNATLNRFLCFVSSNLGLYIWPARNCFLQHDTDSTQVICPQPKMVCHFVLGFLNQFGCEVFEGNSTSADLECS